MTTIQEDTDDGLRKFLDKHGVDISLEEAKEDLKELQLYVRSYKPAIDPNSKLGKQIKGWTHEQMLRGMGFKG